MVLLMFGKIRCIADACYTLFTHGLWIRHLYKVEEIHPALIWHNDKSWVEVTGLNHVEGTVEEGYVETCKCIYCGKREQSWYRKHSILKFYNKEELKELSHGKIN